MQNYRILNIFPKEIRREIEREKIQYEYLQEIKLRMNKPLIIVYHGKEWLPQKRHIVTEEELHETIDYVSNYSLYAFEHEMKQGFITIEGGHRVGMAGQVIVEANKVKNIKYISSVNIRISHEVKGCADEVFPYITYNKQLANTMIISPPGCGKTTLLRDIIRQVSDGNAYIRGMTVGVVDERSEIGGSYRGVPQNQVGIRTDILDCCPKAEGMIMLIRSMNPQVVAVDEIGSEEDVHAIEYAIHCGCKLLVTAHGKSYADVKNKPGLTKLINEKIFERYIVLENREKVGEIEGVYNENGNRLW